MLRPNQIAIAVIGILVIGGGAFAYLSNNSTNDIQEVSEEFSVSGNVVSINPVGQSFILFQTQRQRAFSVVIGEETKDGQTLLSGLQMNDQVLVESSHVIPVNGGDIINPNEVKILR